MSCQFFRGLPGFLFMLLRFQFKAWFGILQSSILTCGRPRPILQKFRGIKLRPALHYLANEIV